MLFAFLIVGILIFIQLYVLTNQVIAAREDLTKIRKHFIPPRIRRSERFVEGKVAVVETEEDP